MHDLSHCTIHVHLQTSIVYTAPCHGCFFEEKNPIYIDNHLFPAPINDPVPIHDPVPISDHAPFRQGSIVSQYMDVYVSQSEIHMLQKAGTESTKTPHTYFGHRFMLNLW